MTGTVERISLKDGNPRSDFEQAIIDLHKERYAFCARFVKGARVLDLACGTGYGSKMLLDAGAAKVYGVDLAQEAIDEAKELYSHSGLTFFCADYRDLIDGGSIDPALQTAFNDKFDVIVSVETIEHMPDPSHFLSSILQGLREEGLFIGSVPVTPSMDANPYHLSDFSPKGFRRLLEKHGVKVVDSMRQRQSFNPFSVRKKMKQGRGEGLRQNLGAYYLRHPSKFVTRVLSVVRNGFTNLYDVVVARKFTEPSAVSDISPVKSSVGD